MPLLKATNPAAAKPQPFSLRDVERQAAAMLQRAQQQASSLLQQAQAEADHLRQAALTEAMEAGAAEGRKRGIEQGHAAGRQQALQDHKAELTTLLATLASAAGQLDQSRQELVQQGADAVVELAVAIARKAVARFAVASPETLIDTVNEALRYVVARTDVQIVVHPSQEQLLGECLPQIQARWPNLRHVRIATDPGVAPGGAQIRTQHGEVDATLDGMIDRISEQIFGSERPSIS